MNRNQLLFRQMAWSEGCLPMISSTYPINKSLGHGRGVCAASSLTWIATRKLENTSPGIYEDLFTTTDPETGNSNFTEAFASMEMEIAAEVYRGDQNRAIQRWSANFGLTFGEDEPIATLHIASFTELCFCRMTRDGWYYFGANGPDGGHQVAAECKGDSFTFFDFNFGQVFGTRSRIQRFFKRYWAYFYPGFLNNPTITFIS